MSKERLKIAREKLASQTGLSIGSAYGYANKIEAFPEEFLIVWSDKQVKFPKTFEGFKVVCRGIPRPL